METEKNTKGFFEPIPRLKEGMMLAGLKVVNSCMDISDGLSSSLYQLHKLNDVGFEIEKEKIPLAQDLIRLASQEKIDAYDYGLHFGGDYELLLTVPPDKFEKAKRNIEKTDTTLTSIGHVTKNRKIYSVDKGSKIILPSRGYQHFRVHDFC